jgi:hypothetical protein
VKPSSAANDNLIDRTVAVWRARSQRELTREDARQIVENVSGFFSILYEWSRAEFGVAVERLRASEAAELEAARAREQRGAAGRLAAQSPNHVSKNRARLVQRRR